MWGRKKEAKVVSQNEYFKEAEEPEVPVIQPIQKQQIQNNPVQQEQKGTGRIISTELLEGGLFRFVIIANTKKIGEAGDEFEI